MLALLSCRLCVMRECYEISNRRCPLCSLATVFNHTKMSWECSVCLVRYFIYHIILWRLLHKRFIKLLSSLNKKYIHMWRACCFMFTHALARTHTHAHAHTHTHTNTQRSNSSETSSFLIYTTRNKTALRFYKQRNNQTKFPNEKIFFCIKTYYNGMSLTPLISQHHRHLALITVTAKATILGVHDKLYNHMSQELPENFWYQSWVPDKTAQFPESLENEYFCKQDFSL